MSVQLSANKDINLEILSHLSFPKVMQCRRVCKSWELWTKEDIFLLRIAPEALLDIVKKNIQGFLDVHAAHTANELVEHVQAFADKLPLHQAGRFICIFPFQNEEVLSVTFGYGAFPMLEIGSAGGLTDYASERFINQYEVCVLLNTAPNISAADIQPSIHINQCLRDSYSTVRIHTWSPLTTFFADTSLRKFFLGPIFERTVCHSDDHYPTVFSNNASSDPDIIETKFNNKIKLKVIETRVNHTEKLKQQYKIQQICCWAAVGVTTVASTALAAYQAYQWF